MVSEEERLDGCDSLERQDRFGSFVRLEKIDGRGKTASLRRKTTKKPYVKFSDLSLVLIGFVFPSAIFLRPSP